MAEENRDLFTVWYAIADHLRKLYPSLEIQYHGLYVKIINRNPGAHDLLTFKTIFPWSYSLLIAASKSHISWADLQSDHNAAYTDFDLADPDSIDKIEQVLKGWLKKWQSP